MILATLHNIGSVLLSPSPPALPFPNDGLRFASHFYTTVRTLSSLINLPFLSLATVFGTTVYVLRCVSAQRFAGGALHLRSAHFQHKGSHLPPRMYPPVGSARMLSKCLRFRIRILTLLADYQFMVFVPSLPSHRNVDNEQRSGVRVFTIIGRVHAPAEPGGQIHTCSTGSRYAFSVRLSGLSTQFPTKWVQIAFCQPLP